LGLWQAAPHEDFGTAGAKATAVTLPSGQQNLAKTQKEQQLTFQRPASRGAQ
jgi:hypothetical protein